MSSLLFPLHRAALCYLDQRQEIINSLTCQKSGAGKRATWSLPSSSVCGEAQRSVLRGWDGLEGTTSSSLGWIGSWEFSPGSQYKVYKASKTSQCVFAAHITTCVCSSRSCGPRKKPGPQRYNRTVRLQWGLWIFPATACGGKKGQMGFPTTKYSC